MAAEQTSAKASTVRAFTRRHPWCKPSPDHLLCCGSDRIVKMGEGMTVPLLARGGAKNVRLWPYVRDDRPWNGRAPPAAFFRFSHHRAATNTNTHLADIAGNVHKGKPAHQTSPVALESVQRIDAIFDIEREINELDAKAQLATHQKLSRPLVNSPHDWRLAERAKPSRHNTVAKAINYMFETDGRWQAFTAFLDDVRI